jgi:Raf kinase inhibitor-like YbhB/YbcL family protein
MYVSGPAFEDGDTMPARFATVNVTGGTGVSVPLEWEGVPAGTRSFVVAIIDTHPVAHGWVHWLVTGVPADVRGLPEGGSRTFAMPAGAVEHTNTGGRPGYSGPQPPVGSGMHDYVTTVYALDVADLGADPDASWEDVHAAMSGHVLAHASYTGRFGR